MMEWMPNALHSGYAIAALLLLLHSPGGIGLSPNPTVAAGSKPTGSPLREALAHLPSLDPPTHPRLLSSEAVSL